jgi:hypothetical protein
MSKISALTLATVAIIILGTALAQDDRFNGTTYRLNLTHVEVTQPVNASSYNLTLGVRTENVSLLDANQSAVAINVSEEFWRGDYIYRIAFGRQVTGDLVYSYRSSGQQFGVALDRTGPVRVVLPEGYATGDRILGIARPDPDRVLAEANGTQLIWLNMTEGQIIEVNFYKEKAPAALQRIFLIIGAAAVIILIEHYFSMRRLRSIREKSE